jgi:flagellar biosynthetic protein FliQ
MSEAAVIEVGRQAMVLALEASLPLLLIALVVGVGISILQAVTQVQEMTLTFVPKLLAAALGLALCGPWILRQALAFTEALIRSIPRLVG